MQKVDYLRHGTIYTTKIIAPEKMIRVTDYDFKPLIENALKTTGFAKEDVQKSKEVTLKYNIQDIDNIIEGANGKEIYVIVGSYNKEEILKK